uniref:Uncharacterized protein n=1 Tax=Timema bartmani TaxID=61472 RepID=A0A7R9EW72_9NEOP|nr:unnamed protein product [Timema bartmani]
MDNNMSNNNLSSFLGDNGIITNKNFSLAFIWDFIMLKINEYISKIRWTDLQGSGLSSDFEANVMK